MNKIRVEENISRDKWLALRRRGIGGSDASVVCGVNKYRSVIELWMDKTGQIDNSNEDTEAAYWGRRLEDIVRNEFSERSGLKVTTVDYMYQHDKYKYMLANLDGEVYDPEYGNCVFEAKTASAFKAAEWNLEIPEEYYLQVQHYMAVTGYKGAYIAALIGGNQFIWKFIPRDEEVIKMLITLEGVFWNYVENEEIPPIDGSKASTELLAKIYPNAVSEKQIELGEEGLIYIKQYLDAAEQEKKIKEIKDYAGNKLKEMLKDSEIGIAGDRKVIWSNIKAIRLNDKALKEKEPEKYNEYTRQIEYRKLAIK
ncbi:YqaJ viral recombinase family nuclease [Aminipila sp.]|uniref:YqaJ viral recombinase family nuclease n=1 Tax=Aminipila sp. TaxID=2060095 RepID=UPI00289FC791|nr:YqaJ viral recombinase family protein [Aminipila sp.]